MPKITDGRVDADQRIDSWPGPCTAQKIVSRRLIVARCYGCDLQVTNTGAAASHARASGHPVLVDYRTEFWFAPLDDGGDRDG